MAETYQVAVLQLTALRVACRAGGIEQDEEVFGLYFDISICRYVDTSKFFCQEYRALILAHLLQQLFLGNQQFRVGILHHEVKAFGGIAGIQRLIGTASLQYAQGCQYHPLAAANEDGNHILLPALHFALYKGSYGIGLFIHLFIGESHVMIDNGQVIRRLCHLTAEQRHDGLRVVVIHSCLVKGIQQADAGIVHKRDAAQRLVCGSCKSTHGIAHTLCETLHHGLTVLSVIIFDSYDGLSSLVGDVEGNLELGNIQLHRLVSQYLLSAYTIIAQHTHLVGEHDISLETEVGGYTCKGIVLVGKGLLEGIGTLMQELLYTLCSNFRGECKGIHEHTHRIGHLQVAAAVGDGGDAHLVVP